MESNLIKLNIIYFLLLLTGNGTVCILTGTDWKEVKVDPRAEELEWISSFAPGSPRGVDKSASRVSTDFTSNTLCPSGITGQFPYPPDCKRFVNCWKGRGMIQVCAPGTLFNPGTSQCDYPDKVKCFEGDGYASGPQPMVTRFPVARPPIAINQRFSRRDKENYKLNEMTDPSYFRPGHVTRPAPRPTHFAGSKHGERVECPSDFAGLYPHPTDCTQFLNCWGGRMFIQKCGPGTYFNPEMSVCDHAGSTNCDPNIINGLQSQKESEINDDDKELKPVDIKPSVEDLYNSATNLFDVRTLKEEDRADEEAEKTPGLAKEEDAHVEKMDGRDPSWGKILNIDNSRDYSGTRTLFYDAHGNPVSSNQFWGETAKPVSSPKSGEQFGNHFTSFQEQLPSHHNTKYFPHESADNSFSANGHGDSNVYYLRPHNHVINQYTPNFQSNRPSKIPGYHNEQFMKSETDSFNPQNPGYPSRWHSFDSTDIPGHYILAHDKMQANVNGQHREKVPNTVLLPPTQGTGNHNFEPFETQTSNSGSISDLKQPSRALLPPRKAELPGSGSGSFGLDYTGWKPFFGAGTYKNSNSSGMVLGTSGTGNSAHRENERWSVHQREQSLGDSANATITHATTMIPNISSNEARHQIIPATTYRPSSYSMPLYRGNEENEKIIPSARPFTATVPTPAVTTSPTQGIFLVYPVKNYEASLQDRLSQQQQIQGPHASSYKISHFKKESEHNLKKPIISEIDSTNSEEDLKERDVEIYSPNWEDLIPNAGKQIRLRPLSNHLDGYIEIKNPNGEWGLLCDNDYSWMINEANVACKQLGYARGAQISWQGYPLDTSTESIPVSATEITCNGSEQSLTECRLHYGNDCDITKNAVGLRCFDNVTSQCHPEEVEFNDNCYRIVKRDDLDDGGLTLEEAAEYCNKIGGRLSDITSREENDFISEWLMEKHPEVRSVLTGGIGSSVMGRSLWMWFGSSAPMVYQNWWKGWAEEKKIRQGTVHKPSCVVLRKSYPCFLQNNENNEMQVELELGNLEPEFCSTNYFYWDVEECEKLKELKLPHLCKKPLETIGCVVGRGENYTGTASVSSSGVPCLPWDHPEVKQKLANRITLQEWSTKLAGHNFCRNLGRQELHPWCFVHGKENSEYCAIPQCWHIVPGYSKSAIIGSSCDEETEFECKPGECVERRCFCNGKKECSNGRDEAMCNIFVGEFTRTAEARMKGEGREEWPEVNENSCAKYCLESKKFKCKSFNYERSCVLYDRNSRTSGAVVHANGWSYYELSVSSVNCSGEKKMVECKNGRCVEAMKLCDGRDNCGDNSDEVECGYEMRLAGSNETNKGRVEVKILGEWGAVCENKFDLRAGQVVCRELGFKHGVAEILRNVEMPRGEDRPFLVDDLECLGNETSIRECSFPGWGIHDCKPEEMVGVVCRVPETECREDEWNCRTSKECIPIRFLCDHVSDCDDGSDETDMCNEPIKLRLSGGPNATAGRIEIRYLGTWGTICDDNFNDASAMVICRILGYTGPSYVLKNAHFGPGKGPIWLDGIQCFGNETNVNECDHFGWGKHNCNHEEDVSISCSNLTLPRKSFVRKPVAVNSEEYFELTPAAKVQKILFNVCNGQNGSVESSPSVGIEPRARVVGSDTLREPLPWQGSVRVRSPGGKSSHWCGAIVISPYHLLSAGHCLRDYSKPAYFIRVGDFDTETKDAEEQEFNIDHLYIHPEFNRKLHLNNDIALIKIKGEIRLGKHVTPACLPPSTDIYIPGTNCSISGWGSISAHSSGYARTLRRAYIPILEPSLCRAGFVYGNALSEGMFCAGKLDGGVDSCQGDSGGPIICYHQGREYVYGITSWGLGCGRANKPGVYTNVAYYNQWIQEKLALSLA